MTLMETGDFVSSDKSSLRYNVLPPVCSEGSKGRQGMDKKWKSGGGVSLPTPKMRRIVACLHRLVAELCRHAECRRLKTADGQLPIKH